MKTKWMLTILIALAFIGTANFIARAGDKDKDDEKEKETSLDKIPAAAKASILKEVGDNKITKVLEGTKNDKTYYEAQYNDADKKMEVKVDADGKVLKKGEADDDDDKDKK